MHIPDGFIDAPVSAAALVVSAGALTLAIRRSREELDDRLAPMAGLTAAFVFAMQMLNFPIAAGTSGHLMGGVLAACLVGPWVGSLCIAVVLVVQALLFADGGLTALGLNILNMAVIGALGGYAIVRALSMLGRGRVRLTVVAGIAAWASMVMAAGGFMVEYALGGTTDVPVATVAVAMLGTHALIGIGEGIITALVVGAVLAVRPDMVYVARRFLPPKPLIVREPVAVGAGGGTAGAA